MSRKLISIFMALAVASVCLLAGCEQDEIHVHREVTVEGQPVEQDQDQAVQQDQSQIFQQGTIVQEGLISGGSDGW